MEPISESHKTKRVKTEGDKLAAQIERQKSIFKNLSWQVKQKDRKISFLQRYYGELQAVIQKEKEDDSALMQRAHNKVKKPGKIYVQKSSIVRKLYPSDCKRRIITNISQSFEPRSLIERSSVNRSVMKNSSRKQ